MIYEEVNVVSDFIYLVKYGIAGNNNYIYTNCLYSMLLSTNAYFNELVSNHLKTIEQTKCICTR